MKTEEKKIYLASPFFSQSERQFNELLVRELETHWSLFYPHRDGPRMSDLIAQGISLDEAAKQVWLCDLEELRCCALVVAVLDGRVSDEGVCVELGLAKGMGKCVIGVFTDSRRCFPWGANPMVTGSLSKICYDPSNIVQIVKECFEVRDAEPSLPTDTSCH
jgi:nucleoside 2-deoxyribosyltransferase